MAELVKVSTPVGKLMWVNISGQGKLNYNEDGYDYVASVILDKEVAKPLIDQIKEVYEDDCQKGREVQSLGYKACTEEGLTKNEDGSEVKAETAKYFAFNFKTKTTFKDDKPKKITVYNSNAKKVDIGDTRIGNGTIGAISGSIRYYFKGKKDGVSLWLNSVQIIKLVEYTEDAGFEASKEGGFTGVEDTETGFVGQPEELANETPKAKPRL